MAEVRVAVSDLIEQKIAAGFVVEHFELFNESHLHKSGPGAQSHFKLVLVSPDFSEKRPVQRHQMVYGVLREELAGPVHALALHTYTPDEWVKLAEVPASTQCSGH